MKKIIAIIMLAAMSLSVVACGGGGDNNGGGTTQSSSEATPYAPPATTTGKLEVEILSATMTKDMNGKDAVVIDIKFKNGTSKTQNFKAAVNCIVKQGDTSLDTATIPVGDVYKENKTLTPMESGTEADIQVTFILNDTTTALNVDCTLLSGEDKSTISKTLELS